jgi:DNA modification methylase
MTATTFLNGRVTLHAGNCLDRIKDIPDASIDAVVTDPPYALVSITKRFGKQGAAPCVVPDGKSGAYARASAGFMGKAWDVGDVAFAVEFWTEVYRVLKPGGHVLAFGGTRTVHRLTCAIEDAGFEIRDMVAWLYGSGFPKSHDVSKGIDRAAGAAREVVGSKLGLPVYHLHGHQGGEAFGEGLATTTAETRLLASQITASATAPARQWEGWGTALKPALEPITFARKPLEGTVAANVLAHGTGALNIAACRVGTDSTARRNTAEMGYHGGNLAAAYSTGSDAGRWPANLIHDGSDEVVAAFPESSGGAWPASGARFGYSGGDRKQSGARKETADSGSAARFFYNAKADSDDRIGSKHPTVKPVDLMRYLVRLVTPPGGTVLDPFAGTGTTGEAAFYEGFNAVLIEREEEYRADIARRMGLVLSGPDERKRTIIKTKAKPDDFAGTLFAEAAE